MTRRELPIGSEGEARLTVEKNDLASVLGGDPGERYPGVFQTSRMIALMEVASGRAMRSVLEPGELSVGVVVDVRHGAPTPLGGQVTARAKFTGMDGKLYCFEVIATDDAGVIGNGIHKRAVIEERRLLDGAARRKV
jgi:predicted thioesterase